MWELSFALGTFLSIANGRLLLRGNSEDFVKTPPRLN